MILHRKKPKLYSAHRTDSKRIRKQKATVVYLAIEPIIFYVLVSAVTEVSAHILLPEKYYVYIHLMSFVLGFILPLLINFSAWIKKKNMREHLYIEHMTYLFCKYKDFKKCLMEIRDAFPKKEECRVINMSLFTLQESGRIESSMKYIEQYFSSRKTKLLHRYILESRKRSNYNPPAEILTCITTNPVLSNRSQRERRRDRWTIFLCALISMGICVALEVLGKESGFLTASYESTVPKIFAFSVFTLVFVIYELKENIIKGNVEKYKLMKVSEWLKELTFFLLVMPVPQAIAKSVEFSDWTMKKKISRLALTVEQNNCAEGYLEFADKFSNDTVTRIMEFLYAKSSEPYLAPAELTAMLRQLDEIIAKEVSRALFVEKSERTSLLLAPQLATFVMLFGNILTLLESVGRKL